MEMILSLQRLAARQDTAAAQASTIPSIRSWVYCGATTTADPTGG